MATKRKISELPISTTFKGLFTIGVDALNKSVKVSLEFIDTTLTNLKNSVLEAIRNAESATSAAQTATTQANTARDSANSATTSAREATTECQNATEASIEATEECREVIDAASQVEVLALIPTSMSVKYPERITFGNVMSKYIEAVLSPKIVRQNVIYLGDNKAVSVAPNGLISVLEKGTSVVHVIPTCNVALYKTIQIQVIAPTARLVTRSSLRLTASGNFRLN
jgi:hypothetical protein